MTGVMTAVRFGERLIDAADRPGIDVTNPADLADTVGTVPALTPDDVAQAFALAATAQPGWRNLGWIARGEVLFRAAAEIRSRADELTALIVRENGKLWAEAAGEVGKAAEFFEYYAGFGRQPYGELLSDLRPDTWTLAQREPLGVVLLITPWNDPLLTPARKLAPALISGNSVIIKPAMDTPLIAIAMAEALRGAGLPDGVLTVVTGQVADISEALLAAPELAAVSFTGSTAVGNSLRASLASRNIPLQTEMGGKNAAVVTDSADLELTVAGLVSAAFAQAGQRCTATSRLIVSEGIADRLLAALKSAIRALQPGPGADRASTFGPVINPARSAQVLDYVSKGTAEGASVIAGGEALLDGELAKGVFVAPTILLGVGEHDTVWREEIFGPVLAVHRPKLEGPEFLREAVRITNDSSYGLSASIYTSDLGEAMAFANAVDTGQVAVNLPTSGWDVHHPFGGFADSGSAFKEQGREALTFYSRVKTVAVKAPFSALS